MSEHSYEGVHEYYLDRIRFAMEHNFQNREELLSMISRVAFVDSFLTTEEYRDIINKVQEAHKKSMEMNRNDVWNF